MGGATLVSGTIKASALLHYTLLVNCLHSPLTFFDITPVGRLINRFGKDVDVLDIEISKNLDDMMKCLVRMSAVIFIVSYSTPLILTVVVPLGIMYILIQVLQLIRLNTTQCINRKFT